MKTRLLLFFALVWLSACDKDADGPGLDYPATFELKRIDQVQPVRMFTRKGEVKDQTFIKGHALTLRMQSLYDLGATEPEDASGAKITFLSGSEAAMDNGRVTKYEVQKQNDALVLTSKEERNGGYSRYDEFYMNLLAGISKHKPLIYDIQPLPPALNTGYDYTYKTKERLVASLKRPDLLLHRLAYAHQRQSSGRGMVVSNQFDPTGISLLREGDTLVVQEFAIVGVPVK
ncbi:hypothetical protein [Pontibacter amylolyticus]|uniref:Uncharacterized protein n=1 Tax=Pontibacter amylolyticus TaxID=1424080 RepID=A0ABQ1VYB5_9BACT|nr:hypothetical protein [Pontibacter amylolyticus]GGG03537.1 hypothetical protein GCM10011323_05450 [Pontibacter amylolyticus]